MNKHSKNKRDNVLKNNKRVAFRIEWLIPVVILAVGVAFILWPRDDAGKLQLGGGAYKRVKAADGVVSIPIDVLGDYQAKYYTYKFPEKTVNFFLLKSADDVVRAAFDACDVCFREKKGYRQEGNLMVCNNCGQTFPSERINIEKGGCNPAPLERSIQGDQVVLQVTDIYQGARYF